MSYIPTYIRPVATSSTASSSTASSSSHHVGRSTVTSPLTSPCMSLASSARTSPTRSMKDENLGLSPKATGCRRYDRRSTSYVGYREDYIRKQNDKVSGRKSFEERLKSLEADASVKLQIRRGSQNRRRRSGDSNLLSRLRSRDKAPSISNSTSNSSLQKEVQNESSPPTSYSPQSPLISSPLPPDITESQQPNSKEIIQPLNLSSIPAPTTQTSLCAVDESSSSTRFEPTESLPSAIKETHIVSPEIPSTSIGTKGSSSNLSSPKMRSSIWSTHQSPTMQESTTIGRRSANGQPFTTRQLPTMEKYDNRPSSTTKQPTPIRRRSAVGQSSTTRKPSATIPPSTNNQSTSNQQPETQKSTSARRRLASEKRSTTKQPSTTQQPSTIENQSSTQQPSAIEKPFTVGQLPTTHQPSITEKSQSQPFPRNGLDQLKMESNFNGLSTCSACEPVVVTKTESLPSKQVTDPFKENNTNDKSQQASTIDPPTNAATRRMETIVRRHRREQITDASKTSSEQQMASPPVIVSNIAQSHEKERSNTEKSTEIGKPVPRRDKPIVIDITTDSAVVPVELRSPRGGHLRDSGASRVAMREKRNARVFVFPSSDDSETENILAKLQRSQKIRPEHDVTLTNSSDFAPNDVYLTSRGGNTGSSHTSSSSSLPNDGKRTSLGDKSPSSNLSKEQRRKSSRSPKRSPSKRSLRPKCNFNQSSPTSRARTSSSGSRSPATISAGSADAAVVTSSERQPGTPQSGTTTERNVPRSRMKSDYAELTNSPSRMSSRSYRKFESINLPSPRTQAVADAVKFGFTDTDQIIPYIDDATMQAEKKSVEGPKSSSPTSADPDTAKRAFPLSRGRRSTRKRDEPRRSSYKEAVKPTDAEEVHDMKSVRQGMVFSDSDKEEFLTTLGKLVRCNSADSVLSASDASASAVVRRGTRSSSADRNSLKGVYRRSYQIATNQLPDPEDASAHLEERRDSIQRLKNLFAETSQSPGSGYDESRRVSRSRTLGPPPILIVNHWDDSVVKEGFLFFKVATIEKGKRTSAQKSWKLVWVVLKDRSLYLCKDWSRNKHDPSGYTLLSYASPAMLGLPPSHLLLEDDEPLNIQGSLVSIAYNYLKRKHVFRVTTFNGSEYLFQAEDRSDMLLWIHSIQIHGNRQNNDTIVNEDLILKKTNEIESGPKQERRPSRRNRSPKSSRRVTTPVKEDGSRRFKWKGSVNKIVKKFGQGQNLQFATFDVPLEECPASVNNELVPYLVDLCCRIVEQHGLSFIGIYRVPGNNGTIAALQEELNMRGPEAIDFETDDRFCDLNIVSSLLKSFFRRLPDPLFTNDLYDDFIAVNRRKDREERLKGLRNLIHMLPPPHFETLKFLITHLRKVADNADSNKMEVRNLAIVFGPTLIRNTATSNMASMVTDMSDQCRIIESLLQHASWFFISKTNGGLLVPVLSSPLADNEEPSHSIDQLLANIPPVSGETSDTASESSKSKFSGNSERDSFSRDVISSLFGSEQPWSNLPPGRSDKSFTNKETSWDDEYQFKSSPCTPSERGKDVCRSTPQSPLSGVSITSQNHGSKSQSNNFKPTLPGGKEHLPLDYHSRLQDFFTENLERLTHRPLPHFSSSSTESLPQVTPRSSVFGFPPQMAQRTFPKSHRRLSEGKVTPVNVPPFVEYTRQSSTPLSSPRMQRHSRLLKDPKVSYSNNWQTNTIYRDARDYQLKPVWFSRSRSELSSRESVMADVESDSDASMLGNSTEDKLRNLPYSLKKAERGGLRYRGFDPMILKQHLVSSAPLKQLNKNVSPQTLMDIGSLENLLHARKNTNEMYQQRKAQRQHYHVIMRSSRSGRKEVDLSRCTSDENVYSLGDSLRALHTDAHFRRPLALGKPSHRRHTLSSGDFPDQSFWDRSQYASMQNITRDVHDMTLSRLRPQLRASAPSLVPQTASARLL